MNTYICSERDRDCPKECQHSYPHEKINLAGWTSMGKESEWIRFCDNSPCECPFRDPIRVVECKLYDSGTGDLFEGLTLDK